MLPTAKSHLELQRTIWQLLQQQPGQGDVEQDLLARPQLMASAAAIQPVWRRLYRPNAALSVGTRSVFSHVKVPFVSSGSRPKCP